MKTFLEEQNRPSGGMLIGLQRNRLEALVDDRRGQHSIRINDQYRVCFVWSADGPERVEIADYH
jgi:plasmid maintenance system killer protein